MYKMKFYSLKKSYIEDSIVNQTHHVQLLHSTNPKSYLNAFKEISDRQETMEVETLVRIHR